MRSVPQFACVIRQYVGDFARDLDRIGNDTAPEDGVEASEEPWHGRPASVVLNLPDLSTLWLAYDPA